MTENRFEYTAYDDGTESIYDKKEKKYYYDMQLSNIEELLNDLSDENEELKFENNELKCALALDSVDYIITEGKKIDIPPYYEFKNRYKNKKHRREEYDEYW